LPSFYVFVGLNVVELRAAVPLTRRIISDEEGRN
jgi:hypothetical protein